MSCYTLGNILGLIPHWAFLLGTLQITELLCLLGTLKIYSCHEDLCAVNSQHINLYLDLLLGLNCFGSSYNSLAIAARATQVI